MLKGIEAVAREVDIDHLPEKAHKFTIVTIVTYALWIILEAPLSFIDNYVLAILSLITILGTLGLIIINLSVIYTCYMKICMPGDEGVKEDKPSRFAFVNEYRARKAERDEELARERTERMKKSLDQKKGKKK
jgi:hypothetical protein